MSAYFIVDTYMNQESLTSCPPRRRYSQQFKAELVAQCLEGVESIASLAVEQGMNPNVLHRWIQEHRLYGRHTLPGGSTTSSKHTLAPAPANWIALPSMSPAGSKTPPAIAAQSETDRPIPIQIELAGRGIQMTVHWPAGDYQALASWTRELLA